MGRGVTVIGNARCVECLYRRLRDMKVTAMVVASPSLLPGDMLVKGGGLRKILLGACGRRCTPMADNGRGFEEFLDRIRNRAHPKYGELAWNGESREITETVLFEKDCGEADEAVRWRALRYLEALTEEERAAAEIDVVFREGRPVRAVLKAQTSELSLKRLAELKRQAGVE